MSGYSVQFGDADLSVAGILVTQHNLNLIPAAIAILDANGEWIYPDRIEALTATTIAINLESFRPLQSSWRLVVSG